MNTYCKTITLLILFLLFFQGCSSSNHPKASTKYYKHISQNAIQTAFKRVVKLSNDKADIFSYRNKVETIQVKPISGVFNIDMDINNITLFTEEYEEGTFAKLIIFKKSAFTEDTKEEVIRLAHKNTHDLVWNRLEYILGINDSWESCSEYRLLLNFDGILCNYVHNSNKYVSNKDIIDKNRLKIIKIDTKDTLLPLHLEKYKNISLPHILFQKQSILKTKKRDIKKTIDIKKLTKEGLNLKDLKKLEKIKKEYKKNKEKKS